MRNRYLCQLCLVWILLTVVLYYAGGERFYKRLRPSVAERSFEEDEYITVRGRISQKESREDYVTLLLENVAFHKNKVSDEKILVYLKTETNLNIPGTGDMVQVSGKIRFYQEPRNPGNFNQKFYYQRQNIHAYLIRAALESTAPVRTPFGRIKESLWRIRSGAEKTIKRYLGESGSGILSAMLLGDRKLLDADTKELYQKAGIGHLYAVSGLHVSFFGMGLYRILRKVRFPAGVSALGASIFLFLYVLLVGAGVSAVRAMIMFWVRMGAEVTGRVYDGLTALAAAAMVILIGNPLELWNAGFVLSFGALIGIYGILPLLVEGVCQVHRNKKLESILTAIAVNLAILPVMLFYYYEYAVYSVVWNMAVLLLAPVIFGSGSIGTLLGSLEKAAEAVPLLAGAAGTGAKAGFWLTDIGLRFYEAGSRLCLKLPGNRRVTGKPSAYQVVFYYVSLFTVLMLIRNLHTKEGKIRRWTIPVTVLLLAVGTGGMALPHGRKGEAQVVMLDVGQGDCFFVRAPNGGTILIDGGSSTVSKVGQYRIEPFLKSQGVAKLDYVFVSHGDADHMNGIEEMLDRQDYGVRIQSIILPVREVWDKTLEELSEKAKKSGAKVWIMEKQGKLDLGGLTLTCLWPGSGYGKEAGNEASLVLGLTYGSFDMLFTGDLEKEAEEELAEYLHKELEEGRLPKEYEVLKVGHHGSKNATSEVFLQTAAPHWAFVSAGQGNTYGHPHAEVIKRLAKWGCTLYNTKEQGAVCLDTDGRRCRINLPMQKRRNIVY